VGGQAICFKGGEPISILSGHSREVGSGKRTRRSVVGCRSRITRYNHYAVVFLLNSHSP